MSNFYAAWQAMREAGIDDYAAKVSFLTNAPNTVQPFLAGTIDDQVLAYNVLTSIPLGEFFNALKQLNLDIDLIPGDVPCFSNFEHGACRLNELLVFEPNGLTYSQAGYLLMNSEKEAARHKYGENHSKLASMMSLITIHDYHPCIVKSSPWGEFLTTIDFKDKEELFKKLLLRDRCMNKIITSAMNGSVMYRDIMKNLSTSTALRRRCNVRGLVEFILTRTEYQEVLDRIIWEM